MDLGFIKIGAYTPEIKVADTLFNAEKIKEGIAIAKNSALELVVFPELSITGATIGDLVYSQTLLNGTLNALKDIADFTKDKQILVALGLPIKKENLIYNVIAFINQGKVLSFVPKTYHKNYNDGYGKRYFSSWDNDNSTLSFDGYNVPFGKKIILCEKENSAFSVGAEIGEDLYSLTPPSVNHAINGALVIVNSSCFAEVVGAKENLENTVSALSERLNCAYVLANGGAGESTTDAVFGGGSVVAESGKTLLSSLPFSLGLTACEIDLDYLLYERAKRFNDNYSLDCGYQKIEFSTNSNQKPQRAYKKLPFVPQDNGERADLILDIQAEALKKRIMHTNAKSVVLGLSGGLDSTLALIVSVVAMKKLSRSLKDVVAVTMPCFGTTSRTYQNTIKLAKAFGVTLKKVDITKAVTVHLKDIKHDRDTLDVTFENAQARERTQVIMDIANMSGGLVVGTGDLSEVALGWSTYNGDHMSMYGVNCSVPKTLVRVLVNRYAEKVKGKLKAVLLDVLDTPVSPELLPAKDGEISQKTEDIVGPYVLHDFFLYHYIRRGANPKKIYQIALNTFKGEFSGEEIYKWLKVFFNRFFTQQFKRSCVPDGVKVGSVALSPRGDWKMPSDALNTLWKKELEEINV